MRAFTVLVLLAPAAAWADCIAWQMGEPGDADEQALLANRYALSATLSPLHAPVPHEPMRGAIGLDLGLTPPMACDAWKLREDESVSVRAGGLGLLPRARASFAFPELGPVVPYGGIAYVPPLPVGPRNVVLSGEIGVGVKLGDHAQAGGRFHASSRKTVADVVTVRGETAGPDLFLATSLGVDLMGGYAIEDLFTPYAAVGFTDVSTFFYTGEDGSVGENLHPYSGLSFSVGVDGLLADRLRWGAELYGAPGGGHGSLYTGRVRLGVEL